MWYNAFKGINMKKKKIVWILISLILGLICCNTGQEEGQPSDYNGHDLHRFWPFPVGVAVPGARTSNSSLPSNALLPSNPQYPLLKHFNVVAAENEMKPDGIMPASPSGAYNWTNADALVNYAEANGKRVRGHVLIWHDQTPSWFFNETGTSNRATKAELYTRMETHIKTVFEKYRGRIDTWDVCNEVVDHDNFGPRSGSKYTQIMEDSGLTGIDRYEYVIKAFEWARQYADENGGENVKLYLTDYGIERRFPDTPPDQKSKIDGFEELVDYLIENNAPIDGVGFQGHFRLYDHPVEQISAGIDRFSAKTRTDGTHLTVQVCELDFSLFSNAKSEASLKTIPADKLDERLTALANTYRDFFNMFEQKFNEGKLTMVVIWGIADGHSWLNNSPVSGRTDYPLLFDREYKPKKAFYKLVEGLTPAD
jgi:endo-1,4-beta-xylanase